MYGISSNITLTKGYRKSILANFGSRDIFHINNTEVKEIATLFEQRFFEKEEVSPELFQFLYDHRMIYKTQKKIQHHFPKINRIYESRHTIEFLILDYSNDTTLQKAIEICSAIRIPNLLIRGNKNIIDRIRNSISNLSYPESVTFITSNPSLLKLKNLFRIVIQEEDIQSFVNRDTIDLNPILFTESLSYHTYFHKKIYIDSNGFVKNTPESKEVFLNIKESNFIEKIKNIIITKEFRKYWKVHKDLCDICKHCEFRHMCVDNRIPFQRIPKEWYHENECTYNPFISKWQGEKGYQSIKSLGIRSTKDEFSSPLKI
ncbi:hypothetical protein [Tenacibaculum agarivorans]|uniref:hypothetical protein n=1 Tax=Tenacibaculum agarivorans TaxID=1908389 RepID=UPI00094B9774|nr:hypothetical protein [Tenacibaculum agarivorans]